MKQFTTEQYLTIALANTMGMDKMTWDERLAIDFDSLNPDEADEPNLCLKTLNAFNDFYNKVPSGYIMPLDATASGLQIMACLVGCAYTAERTNLINTGKREDVYSFVADKMEVERSVVKKPVMTHYYGSKRAPETIFNDKQVLAHFYTVLDDNMPGAEAAMEIMQSLWQPNVEAHAWTLPDGHRAVCPVTEMVSIDVEVDDIKFGYRAEVSAKKKTGISLAANIVHSVDGWIVREMARRAQAQGFEMLAIHDSFWARPQHMNKVRQNYLDILMELADMDLLASIASDITGKKMKMKKFTHNLSSHMKEAEYALS